VYLTSVGMVCPVGRSAAAACAAMRAGIDNFEELPYHDNRGEPIIGAVVPGLDPNMTRKQRLTELLAAAVRECLGEKPACCPEQMAVLVGLAESWRPGSGSAWAEDILEDVQQKLNVNFHPAWRRAFPTGHTAGFAALQAAWELLQDHGVAACLVCAVDSYICAATLHWLDEHYRLKTPANQHALIPGEAAAAILLQREATNATVKVIGLGSGKENANVLSDEPLLGLGLTAAARAALAQANLGFHEIAWRLSDVTGEPYGFKELPLLEGRLLRVTIETQPVWHWAECIGDTGAAAGIAQLILADQAFRKGYAPGDTAICLTSSVSGDRFAAVLRRHQL